MSKNLWLAAALFLGAGAAFAEEAKPKPSGLMLFFQNLKNGLRESSVSGRMQKGNRSAVAAVRGDPQDDAKARMEEGTMKQPSKDKKAKQEQKETRAFEAAVDLIVAGKPAEGIEALSAFEKRYPKSGLLSQVAEAKAKAQELQSQGAGEAPAASEAPAAAEAPAAPKNP